MSERICLIQPGDGVAAIWCQCEGRRIEWRDPNQGQIALCDLNGKCPKKVIAAMSTRQRSTVPTSKPISLILGKPLV